jgi:hypothetical protein
VIIAPDGRVSWVEVGWYDEPTVQSLEAHVIAAVPTPAAKVQELIEHVHSLALPSGTTKSLLALLGRADAMLQDNSQANDAAAAGELLAFIRQVSALSGKTISPDDAAMLIALAEAALELLTGPSSA